MDDTVRIKLEKYIRKCIEKDIKKDDIIQKLKSAGIHKDIIDHLIKKVELENYFIYDENKLVEEKKKIEKAQEEFRKGSSLKVDDVMSFPVQTIEKEKTIKDAITKMAEKNIGSLIVTENSKPVGIISERDLLLKILHQDANPKKLLVKDIMNEPLIFGESGESLIEAETKMKLNSIRRMPILKGGELVGIITSSDIIRIMAFI